MNILPTCNYLNRMRVMIEDICPVCRGQLETIFHVFVDFFLRGIVDILRRLATIEAP